MSRARKIVWAVSCHGHRAVWRRIGVAWDDDDGTTTLRLDEAPAVGLLQVRRAGCNDEAGGEAQGATRRALATGAGAPS